MIDYSFIGQKIREARCTKGITQEQLANAVDVGTTHISHIETGNTIPSIKTFIAIVNALDCSADELLCREAAPARAHFVGWMSELVEDCSAEEMKIIADTVSALKSSLRRNIDRD